MKSYTCFTSIIDLLAPSQDRLLTYPPDRIKDFNSSFTDAMSELTHKYDGKLISRPGKGLACYFPSTRDQTNVIAFKNALLCSIEQLDRMGPLSHEMWKLQIRKTSYKICIDYETLNYEKSLEEVFNRPDGLPHISKIRATAPSSAMGEALYKIISHFPELREQFSFRKIGECIIPSNNIPYSIYIFAKGTIC